jgi:nitroreductase
MAPTARNVQPWLFGAITDEDLKKQIRCAATENILLACSAHGIASCWVAGHKKPYVEAVRKLLNVPQSYTLVSLVAAGYSDDKPVMKKKPFEEVVFFDRCEG